MIYRLTIKDRATGADMIVAEDESLNNILSLRSQFQQRLESGQHSYWITSDNMIEVSW